MASDPTQAARIVHALSAPDSALRRSGAELVVDHALGLRAGALFDADQLAALIVSALSDANVARALERHVLPGIARVRELQRAAGERVGDGVPEPVRARIEALAGKPDGPRFGWMRGALDPARLRELLAPALQETLLEFVRELPLAGALADAGAERSDRRAGLAAGLVGRLGREVQKGTERLVHVGRSVAGGLGVDLERRFQEVAREFSQGAVAGLQRALRERSASADGAKLLADLSHGVVGHIMHTPVETILRDLDRLPLADALALLPATIEHNLCRELGRRALEGEARAWLELEGARSLRELLAEASLLEQVRTLAVERVHASTAELFGSTSFARWLEQVLAAADDAAG
jgi:hypothetical protein